MSKRITMVGSANIDFIMNLPRLPQRGETVTALSYSQTFGGKGSNQAVAARRSGGEVSIVVSIGADSLGKTLLENYRQAGLDVSNVVAHEDAPCGTCLIYFDQQGDNMLAYTMGANALLSPEQVEKAEAAIAESAIVMMQMEVPDAPMAKAMELAKKHGAEIMLNFAPYRDSTLMLPGNVDILVVNETEAGGLLGGVDISDAHSATSAAETLSRQGYRLTVITLGANGSVIAENGVVTHYPTFKIDAKDATAAGDSYCGALAVALVEGKSTAEAARFASAAGAICASRVGAQPSIPTRAEIDEFLQSKE